MSHVQPTKTLKPIKYTCATLAYTENTNKHTHAESTIFQK